MGEAKQPATIATDRESVGKWKAIVAEYQKPNAYRAGWQVLNSVGAYVGLWGLMYLTHFHLHSWWLTIALALLAGTLLVRVFIIFHDCGHGSFVKSRKVNNVLGFITGLLTFTPYYHWRWEHSVHHATSGDLSQRGMGDVWTLTVKEYLESSRWKKLAYRLFRNPIVMFVIGPIFLFIVLERFPTRKAKPREKRSVWLMNFAVVALAGILISIFGFLPWLAIQFTAMTIASSIGVWMFYVQHQFEDTYWRSREQWDYTTSAMAGSSFYKLPSILNWFSGNIGYHHIHHLNHKIPFYRLPEAMKALAELQNPGSITINPINIYFHNFFPHIVRKFFKRFYIFIFIIWRKIYSSIVD